MSHLDLTAIVDSAFNAAVQDHLWEAWSLDLMKALGGTGGIFCILNTDEQCISRPISFWAPPRSMEEYLLEKHHSDPQVAIAMKLPRSTAYLGWPGADTSDRKVDDYIKWHRSVGNVACHQTAVITLGDSTHRVGLSIHSNHQKKQIEAQDHANLQSLLPGLQRAMALGFRHGDLLQSAFWDGVTASLTDKIAFLVDEQGRVVRHTGPAEKMISRSDGLDIRGGRLTLHRPDENNRLKSLMAAALAFLLPSSGAMRVSRPSGRQALVLVIYPLPRRSRMFAPAEAAALVTIVEPGSRRRRDTDLYRQAFGLTRREGDLAALLMEGHSVDSAAASLDMATATARTHIRRLYEKTGTTGQAALLLLLGRIG